MRCFGVLAAGLRRGGLTRRWLVGQAQLCVLRNFASSTLKEMKSRRTRRQSFYGQRGRDSLRAHSLLQEHSHLPQPISNALVLVLKSCRLKVNQNSKSEHS